MKTPEFIYTILSASQVFSKSAFGAVACWACPPLLNAIPTTIENKAVTNPNFLHVFPIAPFLTCGSRIIMYPQTLYSTIIAYIKSFSLKRQVFVAPLLGLKSLDLSSPGAFPQGYVMIPFGEDH